MNVLITGVAGFIGYKVAEVLLDRGESVIGVDNINDYYDPRLKHWRLEQLSSYKNFIFYKGDIADFSFLLSIYEKHSFDAVINLAARAGVRASVKDPWIYLETNTKGTLNLLELCKQTGVKKFILSSTSSIYSLNDLPFREDFRTDFPISPYGATKKAAEVLCYNYHYLYGIDIIIPRYFTVYGPAGRPDMSVFKFIKRIDAGLPVPVYGDGHQKRDFTYIDDIAEATVRCLRLSGYELINLGNDNPVELLYVIELIEKNLNKKARIEYLERHPSDIEITWADISKAKQLLNWAPSIKIEEGISRTVKWYVENREFVRSLKEEE